MTLASQSGTRKGIVGYSTIAAEVRYVAGKSLCVSPERLLPEAVKRSSGLYWRLQDVGHARDKGDLLGRAGYTEWNQHKRENYAVVRKARRVEPTKALDLSQDLGFVLLGPVLLWSRIPSLYPFSSHLERCCIFGAIVCSKYLQKDIERVSPSQGMVQAYNPSTLEEEARGPGVQSHPQLHNRFEDSPIHMRSVSSLSLQ